ncbi:cystatin A3 [Heterostelium album PN500]|uniref:Cystatin A3 n=1 Tax=Heterostelium pallidum (strain ATCC 26659 / Pp 5 / PN500) TaxID=670386 RepID=D3AXE8_HETP5|nr:cystatin A3 [Heterostelium album PN500]EFA86217.1 cystatin A3 [Heterostelium album PN500]|eukprot:XP_020438322.1 cystatin A3 [Heterostelium album PN500]
MLGSIKPHEVDAEVIAAVNAVRADSKLAAIQGSFVPVQAGSQVVAGTNYFVKVEVNGGFVHLRIFKALNGEYSLHSIQEGKTLEEPITYF